MENAWIERDNDRRLRKENGEKVTAIISLISKIQVKNLFF